jgi:hypothetical protein
MVQVSALPFAYRAGNFSSLITDENRLITTASGPYVNPLGATIQSGTIFDPASTFTVNGTPVRNAFPNNTIPMTRFDPVAVKVLSYVPLPCGPNAAQGGANYLVPIDEGGPTYIPSIKIDQTLGAKFHTAFYFQNTQRHAPRSPIGSDNLPAAITTSDTTANGGRTIRFNLDHTVTPVLLLHYTFAWNDSNFKLSSQNTPFNTLETLGIPGQTAARTFPEINTTVSTNIAEGGMSNLGGEYDQNYHERRPEFATSATHVKGAHTYKAGFEIRQQKFPNFNYTGSSGIYTVNSNWTTQPSLASTTIASGFAGFGFASFLLGGLSQAEQVAPITAMTYNYESALYVQDDWKVIAN